MIETIEDKANTAFERSDNYHFLGEPISWSYRHEWLWVEISRGANFENEKDALLMMWLGGLNDLKDLKAIKYKHRKDPDAVIEEFEEYSEQFRINSKEVVEAVEVCHDILNDIDASSNQIDNSVDGDKGASKPPKK